MTLVRPTLSELVERASNDIDARLPGADSRLRRSALAALVRMHAGSIDGLYAAMVYLSRQLMPDTAEAAYLDRWASIWGVERKAASGAAGAVTVTGLVGAVVPKGAELARVDGVRFATTARTVLAATTANIAVAAVEPGAASTTAAATALTFTSPASGIAQVAVATAGLIGGADQESDAALLARLLLRIRTPPQGGALNDWTGWALQVPGVTRAWAYPNWTGPGRVGLTFVYDGRPSILPTAPEVAAMAAWVEPLRPVTATPVVFAATALPIDLLISSTPDSGAVRDAIRAELADLFAREAEPGGTMYLSRMNEAVSLAAGEFDHAIRAPAANIVALSGQMPMLGTVSFV